MRVGAADDVCYNKAGKKANEKGVKRNARINCDRR